jgi:hypothetical protein
MGASQTSLASVLKYGSISDEPDFFFKLMGASQTSLVSVLKYGSISDEPDFF